MSERDDLAAVLARTWTPGAVDPATFDAGVRRRALRLRRRRLVLAAGCTAAIAALAVQRIAAFPGSEAAPEPVAQATAPADAWWSEAVDPAARTYGLPGTYEALDALFLKPFDQEL